MAGPGVIVLMGLTGSGKSTFASLLTGQKICVGHGLASSTVNTACYTVHLDSGETIRLVDTPGFDDTTVSDEDILKKISAELATHSELLGIIYLHRITDVRLSGSSVRGFSLLKKLCQPEYYNKIVLATTMWGDAELSIGGKQAAERRESQLWEDHWSKLFEGSKIVRHHNTEDSARSIVELFLGGQCIRSPDEETQEAVSEEMMTIETESELQGQPGVLVSEEPHDVQVPETATTQQLAPVALASEEEGNPENGVIETAEGEKQLPPEVTQPDHLQEPDGLYHPCGQIAATEWEEETAGWATLITEGDAQKAADPSMQRRMDEQGADDSMQLVKRMSLRSCVPSKRASSTPTAQLVGLSTAAVFFTGMAYRVTTFFSSAKPTSDPLAF